MPPFEFAAPVKAVQHFAALYLCVDKPGRKEWLDAQALGAPVWSVLRTIAKGQPLGSPGEPISDFWTAEEADADCRAHQHASDAASRGDLFAVRRSSLHDLVVEEAVAVDEARELSFRRAEQQRRRRIGHQRDRDLYWLPVMAFETEEGAMPEDIGPTYDFTDPAVRDRFGVHEPLPIIDDEIFLAVLNRLQAHGWDLSPLIGRLTPELFWERYGYAFDRLVDDYELLGQRPES